MPKYQFMSRRWENDRPRIPTHARIVIDHSAKKVPIYDKVETYDGKMEWVCEAVQFYLRLFVWWTHPRVKPMPQYKLKQGVNFNYFEVNGWSNKLTLLGRSLIDSCEGLPELIVFNLSKIEDVQDFFMNKIYIYITTPRISPYKLSRIALFYAPEGSRISFWAVKKFLANTKQGKRQIRKKLIKFGLRPLKHNINENQLAHFK